MTVAPSKKRALNPATVINRRYRPKLAKSCMTLYRGRVHTPVYHRADLSRCYLPVEQMLQIDRVMEVTADIIRCEMDLATHWVFPLHFPKDPIFPACLMIEAAGQAIAIWAWHHQVPGLPRLARVQASFESGVRPDNGILSFVGKVRRRRNICVGAVELFCGERRVAVVEETLAWVS